MILKKTFGDPDALEGDEAAVCALAIQAWMTTGAMYENLKAYEGGNFGKGELLNFFMEETDPDDAERLYPIVASLSEGQWYGLPFVSFEMHLSNAFADEETWKSQADSAKAAIKGLDELSAYANIDRDIYKDDGTVALTDQDMREKNTANGTTGTPLEQMDTFGVVTAISYAATAISGVVMLGAAAKTGIDMLREAHYTYLEEFWQSVDIASGNSFGPQYYAARNSREALYVKGSIGGQLKSGVFLKYVTFATIALGLISATLTIIDMLRDTSVEQLPIPKYIVDNRTDEEGNEISINYKAVECNREEYFGSGYSRQMGRSADLMADEGLQWLTLYVSRNSLAGNPILSDFAVQGESQAPSGLTGNVHLIGEKGAINVASGSFRNYNTFQKTINLISDKTMYMFYGVSDTPKTYDESSGNMTATDLNSGTAALFGFGGMAAGAVLGAVLANMLRKKKESEAEAV